MFHHCEYPYDCIWPLGREYIAASVFMWYSDYRFESTHNQVLYAFLISSKKNSLDVTALNSYLQLLSGISYKARQLMLPNLPGTY